MSAAVFATIFDQLLENSKAVTPKSKHSWGAPTSLSTFPFSGKTPEHIPYHRAHQHPHWPKCREGAIYELACCLHGLAGDQASQALRHEDAGSPSLMGLVPRHAQKRPLTAETEVGEGLNFRCLHQTVNTRANQTRKTEHVHYLRTKSPPVSTNYEDNTGLAVLRQI
jgi:hypothetical protein